MGSFLVSTPNPSENSSLGSYYPLKILAFRPPPPLLLGISNDPLWWGYEYFLEPHNTLVTSGAYSEGVQKPQLC